MNRYAICLATALAAVCLPRAYAQNGSLDDDAAGAYPIVLTPARLRQSAADVPAAVTVITAGMLQAFGIRNLIDALRLVPGMAITHATGNDYRVNYHGTNILVPRRMNVLVDGVSIYRPGLARVDWKEIPVAIDDIERIEVTRGTNSVAYGPNSMLAVINIITKHPADVPRFSARITAGSLGTLNANVSAAGRIGSSQVRASLNSERDTGYDALPRVAEPHDSTRLTRLYLRSVTPLTENSTLDITGGAVAGTKEVPFADAFQTSFPDQDIEDYYVGATWNFAPSAAHEIQLRANFSSATIDQDWTTCIPTALLLPELFDMWAANPAYARTIASGRVPTGGSARDNALAARAIRAIRAVGPAATQRACATANQNLQQQRTDIELQDTYVFSPRLRLVAGIGARHDRIDSQTFFGGEESSTASRLFANVEYKPIERLRFNLGGYLERDQLTGSTFSPRAAVNVDAPCANMK
jgi:iron complex outermembrane receptor protein